MKCVACNHDNRLGIKFCENCGNQLPQAQATGSTERYCPNCGQTSAINASFCSSCGTNFSVILPAQKKQYSFWKSLGRTTAWTVGSFIIVFLVLNILGIRQTLSPVLSDHTAKAELLAIDFVQENYPELANAERSAYIANIQGTDFYVVDFVLNDPLKPAMGVRILVDRLLRAVFTYEHISG